MNKPDYARENTVAAEKQLRGGPYFPGRVDACPRILFVGNSITLHGRKPEIGWNVEWGMAASAKENDYVHRTMAGVQKAYPNADFAIVQQATWERNFWTGDAPLLPTAEARNWKPHVVIIRLGENTPPELLKNGDYAEALVSLARFYGGDTAEYLVTDEFWPNEAKDDALRRAAETLNAAFVRISDLGEMAEMKACRRAPRRPRHAGHRRPHSGKAARRHRPRAREISIMRQRSARFLAADRWFLLSIHRSAGNPRRAW